MYNEEKLTKLRALKQLAERISQDFADKASVAALAGRVDSAEAVSASVERAMYQAPAPARFWVELAGGLEQTVGALLGEEGLAGLTPSGTDGEGNSLYSFVLNGVTVGSYTGETTLSQIAADISASQAGVEAAWDQEAGRVLFSAKVFGPSGRIEMGEGLAQAVFDPVQSEAQSGRSFTEAYGVGWLKEGESAQFSFSVSGRELKVSIARETTLQEVVNNLNRSPMGMNQSFTCNKYSGQIEAKDKNSGETLKLKIIDRDGDSVDFDADNAPPNPYTPGQAGVFTAIKVNGKMQEAIGQEVDIRVPVKVSELTNDQKFQTEAEVAAAVAAADHLQRKKVVSLEEIDPAAPGADRYIYMVPKAGGKNGDKYDEYMVLDGAVEHVGSTKVDLSGKVDKEEGKGLSSNDYTDEEKAKLAGLDIASDGEVAEMLGEVFGAAG